ncbi:hypothetical protein ACFQ0T_02865 [Kitasatospora gansuensis]
MRVHRSAHGRNFTVLPNALLQDRRLSYTARGLLVDLLSRPDGRREDGRQMADSSTQGRGTVRRALKELTAAGYYRVDTVRLPNGTVRSEAHVFDTPQQQRAAPGVARPGAGEPGTDRTDTPSVEESGKAPSHPDRPDDEARAAADTLLRVVRTEPRLWLGEAEALALAPLVARWLERGCTASELARAMLDGLPGTVHSPSPCCAVAWSERCHLTVFPGSGRGPVRRVRPVPRPGAAAGYLPGLRGSRRRTGARGRRRRDGGPQGCGSGSRRDVQGFPDGRAPLPQRCPAPDGALESVG